MTIAALIIRRFNVKADGVATMARVAKAVELPVVPPYGALVDFNDGTSEAPVSTVRVRARGSHPPAVAEPGVEILTKTEDGAGLVLALKAGWVALPADFASPTLGSAA